MLQGLFSHKLTGRRGWSSCSLEEIDPALVLTTDVRERLFMLFDKDCPYTLTLKYAKPKQSSTVNVGIATDGKFTYTPTSRTDLYQMITKRYQRYEDAQKEIDEIYRYQKMLKEHNEEIKDAIVKKYQKNNMNS